jgi:hypothetical protein
MAIVAFYPRESSGPFLKGGRRADGEKWCVSGNTFEHGQIDPDSEQARP